MTNEQLKRALKEQVEVILALEEERKTLRNQNRQLQQKQRSTLQLLQKYSEIKQEPIIKKNVSISTQAKLTCEMASECQQRQNTIEASVQTAVDPANLARAQLFLSTLQSKGVSQQLERAQQNKKDLNRNQGKQLSDEIVKMSKQSAALKRQLKEAESRTKTAQKQLKEVQRCFQANSEALQQSRRDFNELSKIYNGDKFKSLRSLESDLIQTKARLHEAQKEASSVSSLKLLLQQLTRDFTQYKQLHPDSI